jgi:hypothetical protein
MGNRELRWVSSHWSVVIDYLSVVLGHLSFYKID